MITLRHEGTKILKRAVETLCAFAPLCKKIFLVFLLFPLAFTTQAQEKKKDEKKKKHFDPNNAVLIVPNYTAQFPFGDMRERFGFNSLFGFHLAYKFNKNWMLGGEAAFLFGTRVRESYVLDNISTSTGQFVSQNNDLITVHPQEQGFHVKVMFGKIIPFSEKYPDAGLLLMTGFGLLQHKIAINVKPSSLPQLDKTYRKGYDRLTNGPVLSQFIGGIFLQRKRFVSFYGGLQFDIGFTQGRRNYDFYLQAPLKDKRLDMFLGIRLGWVIPVFTQSEKTNFD